MKIFFPVTIALLIMGAAFTPYSYAENSPQGSEYKLQSSDVLRITVHGQDDLTTKTRITKDGCITFPLLGTVKALGLTVRELEQELKTQLEKDYLVKAHVIVFIEDYNPRKVSVMGEVQKHGKYDISPEKELTLMAAIAMAEGFTKDAEERRVRVMRVEDGKKKTIEINTEDITNKGDTDKDITLNPDDIVYVPESFF
jgi:protein involved in polysaccharide export with SLBB domain